MGEGRCFICNKKLEFYESKWISPFTAEAICCDHAKVGMDHTTLPEGFQHWEYYTDG